MRNPNVTISLRRIWHSGRWMALGGVVSVLMSCSLGPKYEHPDITPPAAWRGQSATVAQPPDHAVAVSDRR
jgi:hypothetical protein